MDVTDEKNRNALMLRPACTQQGEWIYPREKNCRYLDIFEECPDVTDQDVPLLFGCLIYLNISYTCSARCNSQVYHLGV